MKWYKENYVNRRDWIIENYHYFDFSPSEGILVLAIDYLNTYKIPINYSMLCKKTNLSEIEIDKVIRKLEAKNFVEMTIDGTIINLSLDNLYENNISKLETIKSKNYIDIFANYLGRPLTSDEISRLYDWNKLFDEKIILQALKKAITVEKVNFSYIEGILRNWKKANKNLSDFKL